MNILEFEVHNQTLTRVDSQNIISKNRNIYKCRFTFEEESEWMNINKFVIFTDAWGNTSTQHLGNDSNILSCLVPNRVLDGSYFKISIYGGDLITTNNISVSLITGGYNRHPPHPHHHNNNNGCKHHKETDIFVEIFNRLDESIDSIVYDNHTLHLFSKDNLIESIYLPFVLEDDVNELVTHIVEDYIHENIQLATDETDGLLSSTDKTKLDSIEYGANKTIVDSTLNHNSENPISNSAVTLALDGKEDTYDIVERLDDLIINLINKGD